MHSAACSAAACTQQHAQLLHALSKIFSHCMPSATWPARNMPSATRSALQALSLLASPLHAHSFKLSPLHALSYLASPPCPQLHVEPAVGDAGGRHQRLQLSRLLVRYGLPGSTQGGTHEQRERARSDARSPLLHGEGGGLECGSTKLYDQHLGAQDRKQSGALQGSDGLSVRKCSAQDVHAGCMNTWVKQQQRRQLVTQYVREAATFRGFPAERVCAWL